LKAFRKLVRISPYAMLCTVDSETVTALDFIVALTCDGVDSQRDKVKALGSRAELAMAIQHYKLFTGVDPPTGKAWPVSKLGSMEDSIFQPWSEASQTVLPYMWMGLRHAGLALLNDTAQAEGKEPMPEQLRSMEDAYSNCKVSALFAVLEIAETRKQSAATGIIK